MRRDATGMGASGGILAKISSAWLLCGVGSLFGGRAGEGGVLLACFFFFFFLLRSSSLARLAETVARIVEHFANVLDCRTGSAEAGLGIV